MARARENYLFLDFVFLMIIPIIDPNKKYIISEIIRSEAIITKLEFESYSGPRRINIAGIKNMLKKGPIIHSPARIYPKIFPRINIRSINNAPINPDFNQVLII